MALMDWIPFIAFQSIIFILFFTVLKWHERNLRRINDEWDKLQRREKEATERIEALMNKCRELELAHLKRKFSRDEETDRGEYPRNL